jgi:galactitol-specific phosphotransferase system IIC component
VGYHAGLTGTRRSLAVLSLVLTFSAVMVLIADLDRPMEGLLKVSQQAMIDLRNSLMDPRP